jgi:putative hydrolase of the HAD superfamily
MTESKAKIPEIFLFDYGGVLAEEGFSNGLKAIAAANGLDREVFFQRATELIYQCGYVIGKSSEAEFWNLVRQEFGISASDQELTSEIHRRFILRPGMLEKVRAIKSYGARTAILSDQTDWLDRLNRRDRFLQSFEPVINSYYLGSTKREEATFMAALELLKAPAEQVLFVDDNSGHIERADGLGFRTHLFTSEAIFGRLLAELGMIIKEEDRYA